MQGLLRRFEFPPKQIHLVARLVALPARPFQRCTLRRNPALEVAQLGPIDGPGRIAFGDRSRR